MKSLEELRAIRAKMQGRVGVRAENEKQTRVVVGMATCGIASGARPVLTALSDAVQEQGLSDKINVTQTGCIGLCQYEPIVEVMAPGKEKVTYVKMTPEKALEVLRLHLLGGQVVTKYAERRSGKSRVERGGGRICIVHMYLSAAEQDVPPPEARELLTDWKKRLRPRGFPRKSAW